MGIKIPKICNTLQESLVKLEKERPWKLKNTEFINAYNQIIEDEGLLLDQWRSF